MSSPVPDNPKPEKRILDTIRELFTEHPHSVGESYLEHLLFTLKIAFYLLVTALCAVLHGIFPKILQTTTSDRIIALAQDMQERRIAWARMKQNNPEG
jgi:hypothetical protein